MDDKKQIEEMACAMCGNEKICVGEGVERCVLYPTMWRYANKAYRKGYRKQREGHWFILEYEYFTCSECGYYHPNGCDSTKEAKERLADGIYPKYCSECGAKMGGGE